MPADREQRKLAAIMFTDMVGYSALAQRNEALALELLREQQQVLRPVVAKHGGREVKEMGDGFLLEFASALQATHCAIAIQKALVERNSSVDATRRIEVRIGLHLGDVEVRDGDVFGDGVNIAARVEPFADPGGICITGPVYDQVCNKIAEPLERMRRPEMKHIVVPIDVYRVVLPWQQPLASHRRPHGRKASVAIASAVVLGAVITYLGVWRAADRPRANVPNPTATTLAADTFTVPGFGGRPAIAVLPFDNMSPDPDQAFFADGLAEDLITRLSTWRAFPVIARNSSFQYRGGNRDLKRVSAELGARYVVEGSVRRAGDRIRVTAQLIDAPSGEHVWAETYDRKVTDLFALQDEISATIAASLVGDLNRAESERARQRGTENLEAWSLYQLGLQRGDRLTREDLIEARRLFERAVALDPEFATALGRLALAHLWEVAIGSGDAPEQKIEAALAIARRAVALDPRDPVAQMAQGWAYVLGGDLKNGLDSSRRAVELNPSMPEAWTWLGWTQVVAGDPEAGIVSSERARRLSPQGPSVVAVEDNSAAAYFDMGRYAEALEAGRRLVALRPDYLWGYAYVAMSAAALGRTDEAHAAVGEVRRIEPRVSQDMIQRGIGVSRPDSDARRNAALRQAGLE